MTRKPHSIILQPNSAASPAPSAYITYQLIQGVKALQNYARPHNSVSPATTTVLSRAHKQPCYCHCLY